MTVDEAIAKLHYEEEVPAAFHEYDDRKDAAKVLIQAYESAKTCLNSQHNEIAELRRELATLTELNNALNRDLGLIRAGRQT